MVPSKIDSPICGMTTSVAGPERLRQALAAALAAFGAAACLCGLAASEQGRRGCSGCRRLIDHRDHGVDLHGRALGDLDLVQDAGGRRWNLGIDFVGGDLKQRLIALHLVAGLLQPLVMVPSKIDSPIWGMITSVGMGFLPQCLKPGWHFNKTCGAPSS